MPRNPQQNAEVREARRKQILDAALTVYTRFGYHGTEMDTVAAQAGLAKGLLYYYYKTKRDLFSALFTWMFGESYAFSEALLKNTAGLPPVERLMRYAWGMFGANEADPRLMQFSMRVPFDATAVFGPEGWRDGARKSDLHRVALANIIEDGIAQGVIPATDPGRAANSFWSVFVANAFEYSRLMLAEQQPWDGSAAAFRETVRFCFQGLGVEGAVWNAALDKVVAEKKEGEKTDEAVPQ